MAQRTIPVISTIPQLIQWQQNLKQNLIVPLPAPVPANFTVKSQQGGNYLSWTQMKGADGYEIDKSVTGDFATVLQTISITGGQNVAFFDPIQTASGATPTKYYYRIRSTAGTSTQPQISKGKSSAVISATAIAPNDTVTAPATIIDTSNYDKQNTNSSAGDYRDTGVPVLPSS